MESVNITLRNPKAKRILKDLEDLDLITINGDVKSRKELISLLEEMRTRNPNPPSLKEITKEVETVRKKRYAKK